MPSIITRAKDGTKVTTMTDDLRLTLLAAKASAGLARTLAEQRLHKWNCSHMADAVLLITTELVANAARATPAKQIKFQLTREPSGVLIAVWDSLDDIPEPQPMVELTLETLDLSEEHWDDNGGRGLPIVDTLATAWGFTPDPTAGKWAWARLDT